jgi:hypothetical protein
LFGRVGVSVSLGVGWENVGEQADWELGLGGDWSIGEWIVSLAYLPKSRRRMLMDGLERSGSLE